ncbi:hypothetical protein K488DRAFT_85909 [Vararia minispora EC-137]|uniref:Uncharacterized protein n=1 Tax=Vararia minispora EC-137 TaxID=1314806 RepID=A0ACB8QKK1_9AGAM|nr:hypothetical protein K488DRAFT_85909 [Vararia minispora EC-137]
MSSSALDTYNPIRKHISCRGIVISTFVDVRNTVLSFLFFSHATSIALWGRRRIVVASVALVLLGSLGISIRVLAQMDGIPNPLVLGQGCFVINDKLLWTSYTAFLVTELLTFLLTWAGLYRYKFYLGGTCSLWGLLYQHGVFWIVLAVIVDVPALVFLGMNMNQTMNIVRC